jgi:hypothetical protein
MRFAGMFLQRDGISTTTYLFSLVVSRNNTLRVLLRSALPPLLRGGTLARARMPFLLDVFAERLWWSSFFRARPIFRLSSLPSFNAGR